jgi:protein SCO1/2
MRGIESVSRRSFLKRSVAAAVVQLQPRRPDHGPIVPPLDLPEIVVTSNTGVTKTLKEFAEHKLSALQLMFTTCTTTCPMQGATFERVQDMVPDMPGRGLQLISLSIDPKNDTPKALSDWLNMFHARPGWIGVTPAPKDVDAIKAFFGAGSNPLDPHSTQTHILDRSGRLVYHTLELPPPEQIASILKRM